jgi:FG-GAP-like repeat
MRTPLRCSRPPVVILFLLNLSALLSAQVISPLGFGQVSPAKVCQPFVANHLYEPGTTPSSVAIGDFNGDGIPDLVTAGWYSDKLHVLLGQKDGSFVEGQSFPHSAHLARKVVVGDFNNDGKLDVAVADDKGGVNVLLGRGDGTFMHAIHNDTGSSVSYIAAGDFNHDGKLDIVALGYLASQIQVLFGKGDGTFQAPVNYPTFVPNQVVVADLNGDGNLDLAVANAGYEEDPGSTVSVFFGKRDGTFGTPTAYTVGRVPFGITAADLNGDGKIDLATANWEDGTASVLLNKGDGTFLPATSYAAGHPFSLYAIAAFPLENGNLPGLAVVGNAGIFILTRNGTAGFAPAQGYNPPSIFDPVVADFNGDGKVDLAVVTGGAGNRGASGVAVLFGKGHGVFSTSTAYVVLPDLDAVAAGDFNDDGKADLAVGDTFHGLVAIVLGTGGGRFSPPVHEYAVPYPVAIASGRFGSDKNLDVAALSWGRKQEVRVLRGNGDGTFAPGQSVPIAALYPSWITLADFNGDGVLDMAVTSQGDYADQGAVSIIIGKKGGGFNAPVRYGTGEYLRGAVVGDFNGDGKLDFVLPRYDDMDFVVFLGNGDGTFRQGASYSLSVAPDTAAAGDFNGDRKLDLAVSLSNGSNEIWWGNGDGTFRAGDTLPGGEILTAADLNHDGKIDLVTEKLDGLVQVLLGNGDGTFLPGHSSYIGGGGNFTLADLNGDGALDLAFAGYDEGTVSILLNRCPK